MKLFLFFNVTYDGIMHAASWTLIHSLWQGLILAILAVFVIQLTRRCEPRIRYNLLLVIFSCQLVASIFTFSIILDQFSDTGAAAISSFSFPKTHFSGVDNVSPYSVITGGLSEKLIRSIDSHTRMIINCWILTLSVLMVRMLAGMLYLKRLRRDNLISVGDDWMIRLQKLCEKMHLHIPVGLKESTLVNVPLVIGCLKPLILIPVGLLNNLPPEQVEAIICHELAHIRRNDFIINIYQSILEVVFFFNPSVWWISSLLREERENCCDDAAIRGTGEKKTIIEAFLSFHESQPMSINYVHRFTGPDQKLSMRVKRIFYNRNNAVAPHVQVIILSCIVGAGIMLSAFKNGSVSVSRNHHYFIRTDTVPAGNDLQNKLQEIDRKYAPLQAGSESRVKDIKQEIKALQTESTGKKGLELREVLRQEDSLKAVADEMGGNITLRKNDEVMRLLNPGAVREHIDTAKRVDGEKLAREQGKKYSGKQLGEMDGGMPAGSGEKKYTTKQDAQIDENGGGRDKGHVYTDEELKKREQQRKEDNSRSNAFFEGFLNDLLADGLISNKDGASFFLSKEKFIVSDKLQPDEVRQKYLHKFLTNEHVSVIYRFHSEMIGWMDN